MRIYRAVYDSKFDEGFFHKRWETKNAKFTSDLEDFADEDGVFSPVAAHPSPEDDWTRGSALRNFWKRLAPKDISQATRDVYYSGVDSCTDYRFAFASKKQFLKVFRSRRIRNACDKHKCSVLVLKIDPKYVITSDHQCIFRFDKAEIVDIKTFSSMEYAEGVLPWPLKEDIKEAA